MPTYLLTWNPRRSGYWDELIWLAKERKNRWSCGSRKTMAKGSRVYLFRQGIEPRGIVASGHSVSDVYPDKHWDEARSRKGEMANYVDVRFDVVLQDTAFPAHDVKALKDGVNWRTQMSGIEIPSEASARLERLWSAYARLERRGELNRELRATENTLTEVRVYVRGRDRKLRDMALHHAKGACSVCEVNFGQILDGLGRRVLQVHHCRQLAATDAPRLTRLRDLAVVCANCHAMIHADPKRAMTIAALRRRLAAAGVVGA